MGETVNQHFGRLQNLIFCEELVDEHVLIVVVRNGDVYIDAKINVNVLQSELAGVLVTGEKYHVFLSGKNLPVSQKDEPGKMTIPAANILSFASLEEPVFPRLVVNDAFRLQPISLALKSAQLTQIPPMVWVIASSVLFLLIIAVVVHKSHVSSQIPKFTAKIVSAPKVYPYQDYYAALQSPAPIQILQEMAAVAHTVSFIPGWDVSQLSYNNAQYQVEVSTMSSPVQILRQWAKEHKFSLQINGSGVKLYRNSELLARAQTKSIYDNQEVVEFLLDRLTPILGSNGINLGVGLSHLSTKETPISLNLVDVSPQLLLLLGQELQYLPISLSSISFAMHNGLLTGNINLSAWGN